MNEYNIDRDRLKERTKFSSFLELSSFCYFGLLAFLVPVVSSKDVKVSDVRIIVYVFLGVTVLSLLLSVIVKQKDMFLNYILKIDWENGLIVREGEYAKRVEMRFDQIGRVKFTNNGVLIYKKGYQSIVSYWDSNSNMFDRASRFIIPFEIENYKEVKEQLKAVLS